MTLAPGRLHVPVVVLLKGAHTMIPSSGINTTPSMSWRIDTAAVAENTPATGTGATSVPVPDRVAATVARYEDRGRPAANVCVTLGHDRCAAHPSAVWLKDQAKWYAPGGAATSGNPAPSTSASKSRAGAVVVLGEFCGGVPVPRPSAAATRILAASSTPAASRFTSHTVAVRLATTGSAPDTTRTSSLSPAVTKATHVSGVPPSSLHVLHGGHPP